MSAEMAKLENGGPGAGTEVLITPDGSGTSDKETPAAQPAGDEAASDASAAEDVGDDGGGADALQVE